MIKETAFRTKRRLSRIKDIVLDFFSAREIHKVLKRRSANSLIKVAFLVQMEEIWDKEAPVCTAMLENDGFSVDIIVIPPYNFKERSIGTEYQSDYFFKRYVNAIKAYENRKWYDIDPNQYDFVFYQRPYDSYLPSQYQSKTLVKKTKCCYIPYGFSGADVFLATTLEKSFFRNMHIVFMDSDYSAQKANELFTTKYIKEAHKIVSFGYPSLLPFFSNQSSIEKKIVWCPRWSYDKKIGGSHFLEYRNTIIKLKEMYPDYEVVFRPHPLMFDELDSKNMFSHQQAENYLAELDRLSIQYSKNTPIDSVLKSACLLITDYSSLIIEFFASGKPIIYCESDIVFNPFFEEIAEGMYIARSENDILSFSQNILSGNDYLSERRKSLIHAMYNRNKNSTNKIIEYIVRHYRQEDNH